MKKVNNVKLQNIKKNLLADSKISAFFLIEIIPNLRQRLYLQKKGP